MRVVDADGHVEESTVPAADLRHVAVMGCCQSGRWPLAFSTMPGSRITAVVVFHGAAYKREWVLNEVHARDYDEIIAASKVPVFGAFGEKDFLILLEDVQHFRASLEAANRSYEIVVYNDAPHSWLNDRIENWRQPQAEAAWKDLLTFLTRVNSGEFRADRVQQSFGANTAANRD